MANKLTPVTDNSPDNGRLRPLNEGLYLGREVLPGQFLPVYRSLGSIGLLDKRHIYINRSDDDQRQHPRIDFLRPKLFRDQPAADKLGQTTIGQLIEQCLLQEDSPLLQPRTLSFDLVYVTADTRGRQFVNVIPDKESEAALNADSLALSQIIQSACGTDVDLRLSKYNMNLAVVNFRDVPRGRGIAHNMADAIRPVIQDLKTGFDVLGYAR